MTNYDPWGTPQGTLGTPFGFAGELQQGGNVYLRARWYNSGNGTFTARDSFAGYPDQPASLALYQYTNNLPTVYTDPSGHCPGCPVQPDPRKWDWQGGCDYLKAIAGADRDARYCGIEHASDELSVYGFNPSPGWYRNHIHDGEHWIEAGQQAADWIHDGLAEGKDLRGFAGDVGDALGKAIKRPWQEFADGWRCHDSYLVGRGARGIGEQAVSAAMLGDMAIEELSALGEAGATDAVELEGEITESDYPSANKISVRDMTSDLDPYTTRQVGKVISENPVAYRSYSQLQECGTEAIFDYGEPPLSEYGKLVGQANVNAYYNEVKIFIRNNPSAQEAASTLVHESSHVSRRFSGQLNTQLDEYYAYRRGFLYKFGRRPNLTERRLIWERVKEVYSHLAEERNPFGK